MEEIKKVSDGHEPWEVLYHVVMHKPQLLHFPINPLVSVDLVLKDGLRLFSRNLLAKKRYVNIKGYGGGELLTRCGEGVLPRKCIGTAFGGMPRKRMGEMFPMLFEAQLEFVQSLEQKNGTFYSINLEGVDHSELAWKKTCEILLRYRDLPINIEIKENSRLSDSAMRDLAVVCDETGFRLYVDDLGSSYHDIGRDVTESKSYLISLIKFLHPHIKAVKVDYNLMKKVSYHWPTFEKMRDNLEAFAWYWLGHCEEDLPFVIFEGFDEMPKRRPFWFQQLEELVQKYKGCIYQSEEISLDNL